MNRVDRLSAAIDHYDMSKGGIAERAGMHRQVLTDILSGKIPGTKHLPAICAVLGVSVEWIETGDQPPKWLKKSSGYHRSPSDAATVFSDVVRDIGFRWRRLQSTDPKRFDDQASRLSAVARRALSARVKPLSSFRLPLEELLKMGESFQLPARDDRSAFTEGYKTYLQELEGLRRRNVDFGGSSLPPKMFDVCRMALLAMKAQRKTLGMPWTDVKNTLECLWDRQKVSMLDQELKLWSRDSDLGDG